MKTQLIAAGLILGAVLSAGAATTLRVKGTKLLDSRTKSGNQNLGFGQTSSTQKDYFYRFDLQALAPQAVGRLKAEWVVMYEDWQGHLRVGTRGVCETNVALSKVTAVETDTVQLNQRNWQGAGGRAGKVEDKIVGYGLKVSDAQGNLLAEEYEPSSLKKGVDWKAAAEAPNEQALRALQGLLGGDRDGDRRGPPPGIPPRRRD